MSEAVIDSALQKAIFDVADSPGTRVADVEVRIGQAVNECRSFIEKPPQEYECWLEVGGLAAASLPAEFGATRFVLLGDQDIERLAERVRTRHTVDQPQKLDRIEMMADDLRGRPVAIQCVHARDPTAAVSLATRKLSITLECLNFFADVISYNRHPRGPDGSQGPTVLRIGESRPAIALQMALAADGSFWENQQATKLGTFSLERVHDLPGLAGEAVKRVEALLAHEVRNPVEELLLRAVRWVGRATAAESLEDRALFSEIALECLTRPGLNWTGTASRTSYPRPPAYWTGAIAVVAPLRTRSRGCTASGPNSCTMAVARFRSRTARRCMRSPCASRSAFWYLPRVEAGGNPRRTRRVAAVMGE